MVLPYLPDQTNMTYLNCQTYLKNLTYLSYLAYLIEKDCPDYLFRIAEREKI